MHVFAEKIVLYIRIHSRVLCHVKTMPNIIVITDFVHIQIKIKYIYINIYAYILTIWEMAQLNGDIL